MVWVGFDNPATLGDNETGAAVAAPIWHDYMAAALKDRPVLKFPSRPASRWRRGTAAAARVTDAFKPGQTPGASGPIGAGGGSAASATAPRRRRGRRRQRAAASAPPGGIDSRLGGLY